MGVLGVEPLPQVVSVVGDMGAGHVVEAVAGFDVAAGCAVGALPGQRPGRIPPRVEVLESLGARRGELVSAGALGGKPASEGEVVVVVVDGDSEMAVEGGEGGRVRESAVPGLLAGFQMMLRRSRATVRAGARAPVVRRWRCQVSEVPRG